MTSTKDISFELSMTCLVHISQNFEKRKQSWAMDSNILKKDCPEESVEIRKGKNIVGRVFIFLPVGIKVNNNALTFMYIN